ncbi:MULTISPECIES: autotransporter outer membrane beta-barrel domain-containing protein [unclassified Pseudomonas]|uniref:autotransporter outer membrane beta-barrel domain-containing protein n=1 Tax=unclassified Pseudomonas TaxID=196821 RepID=UPI00244CBD05|nr:MULTISPECIES: autotransporter outer membrane beta-barrel domain-containing protein [unclassified Pseudomonas]MDH0302808.1 autotransporter outer membrane beta-barrel domain-containing protein [Pseudomonas sp. GD04091]MDH1984379.1 autotransporter outer membrane beta-barrel domain-containing protein [Pseudomonas sp. GD03689]
METWILNAAQLSVLPGGETLNITAQPGSTVTLEGATVNGGNQRAVVLTESQGTISNSTLTSATNTGLSVVKGVGATAPGSTVTVTNSQISAAGRGLNVSGGSSATLIDSQVTGTGAVGGSVAGNGLGISLVGGEAILRNSAATGSNRAAGLFANGDDDTAPRLVLDHASLTSLGGSAIVVSNLNTDPMAAEIVIGNGSTLSAVNQTLIEVGLAGEPIGAVAQAHITIDASTLSGNVLVAQGALADIAMNNSALLNGNLDNLRSLSMNASTVNGNLNEPTGSRATATLAAGSRFNGNLSNLGSLSLDASAVNGNVVSTAASLTQVTLSNASTLAGTVANVASLSLDNSSMTGDLTHDAPSTGTLSLAHGSRLTGTVINAGSTSIAGNSTFAMTNDSSVGALSLDNGIVDLRAGQGPFRTLTASSLSGTGTFMLGTDLAGHLSDLVNIQGQAEGRHGLAVQNTGVEPVAEDHAQRVVHTEGGAAQFALLNANGLVDVGTFSYRLEQRDTDWYLVQNAEAPIIAPSTQTAIALFSAAPTVWYGELSTLRSRMGELRGGRTQGGVWARTYGNKYQVSATDQVDYQQTQQGFSFGIDTPLPAQNGQWLIGIMGGYSDSQLNMRLGSNGRIDSYYLGVYSTWLTQDGYYLDAVLKANRFANKADVRMNDGEKAKGDYDNYGIGGSVEAGRHIQLKDGWFIEPYAQVAALWVDGEHYGLDNGMQASSNKADSLLGKVGTYVGRTFELRAGGFVQPYVKVAAVREFARNNDVKVNSTTFHDDLSGGRGELGAGIALQMTEALQVHADFDYSNGKNIEQPWGANVGVRYAW